MKNLYIFIITSIPSVLHILHSQGFFLTQPTQTVQQLLRRIFNCYVFYVYHLSITYLAAKVKNNS